MSEFASDLGIEPLIEDHSDIVFPDGVSRGWIARDFVKEPFGSLPFASAFDVPLIPRSEWPERIQEMERKKTRLSDLCDAMGVKIKNQQNTNYCWIFAPTHCLEIIRAVQGQPYVDLSPASVGAKIKNFHNVGGWGTEGLKYLVDHGCCPSSIWPATAIDRRYDNVNADAARLKFQVDEWWDIEPGNFDAVMTCLFLRLPIAAGLSWWGHEVTFLDPVKLDGRDRFGVRIDNSWSETWGERGRAVLTEEKATPDDAVAPRVATAS